MIYEKFKQEFRDYVESKIGKEKAENIQVSKDISLVEKIYDVAPTLITQYDVGIGIARGGLLPSYLFSLRGLPVKIVDMKRKLNGATWKEIEPIKEEQIRDKKLIIFDNDVVTGRTLKRAVKEINKFQPQKIGLFLLEYYTSINKTYRKRVERFFKGENMFKWKDGRYTYFFPDTSKRIPKEIWEVFAMDKDFGKDF